VQRNSILSKGRKSSLQAGSQKLKTLGKERKKKEKKRDTRIQRELIEKYRVAQRKSTKRINEGGKGGGSLRLKGGTTTTALNAKLKAGIFRPSTTGKKEVHIFPAQILSEKGPEGKGLHSIAPEEEGNGSIHLHLRRRVGRGGGRSRGRGRGETSHQNNLLGEK